MEALKKFVRHPFVSLGGSLVGILLSIFFFIQGIERPEVTSFVHPIRTTVVQADAASALTVSHRGTKLLSDVSAAQVAFWNDGKKAVRRDDILEPVVIQLVGNTPILEASLRKTSRRLAQIELDESQLAKGRLGVSWAILEEGDGAVIQLTYAGSVDAPIIVRGALVGQQRIAQIEEERIPESDPLFSRGVYNTAVVTAGLSLALLLMPFSVASRAQINFRVVTTHSSGHTLRDEDLSRFKYPRIRWLIWVVTALAIAYTVWGFLAVPGPPFGF